MLLFKSSFFAVFETLFEIELLVACLPLPVCERRIDCLLLYFCDLEIARVVLHCAPRNFFKRKVISFCSACAAEGRRSAYARLRFL